MRTSSFKVFPKPPKGSGALSDRFRFAARALGDLAVIGALGFGGYNLYVAGQEHLRKEALASAANASAYCGSPSRDGYTRLGADVLPYVVAICPQSIPKGPAP